MLRMTTEDTMNVSNQAKPNQTEKNNAIFPEWKIADGDWRNVDKGGGGVWGSAGYTGLQEVAEILWVKITFGMQADDKSQIRFFCCDFPPFCENSWVF